MSANPGELSPYRTAIAADWIDYNGHLRDAYYGVVFSLAIDEFMDQLKLDEAYRKRTRCTLYTLETHMHYLREVKSSDDLTVQMAVLDCDPKRIHARGVFTCARLAEPVAVAEAMLLHVRQGAVPAGAPFPPQVEQRLLQLRSAAVSSAAGLPQSRRMEIRRR